MRRIFIGDVQGCADELDELLGKLGIASGDSVFFVGDLVNRGPASLRALRLARSVAKGIVLGNHEARLLRQGFFDATAPISYPGLADLAEAPDRQELGSWIRSWPLLLYLDDICLVHAALPPSLWRAEDPLAFKAWEARPLGAEEHPDDEEAFLLTARYASPDGKRPPEDHPDPGAPFLPWDCYYRGAPTVVFGHWARRKLVLGERIRGLDTGCVYGGSLSAWIAEEDRVLQVIARRAYYPPHP
ncbi:MAG: metallophosphoesterase [Planctomycetota bacterium]